MRRAHRIRAWPRRKRLRLAVLGLGVSNDEFDRLLDEHGQWPGWVASSSSRPHWLYSTIGGELYCLDPTVGELEVWIEDRQRWITLRQCEIGSDIRQFVVATMGSLERIAMEESL